MNSHATPSPAVIVSVTGSSGLKWLPPHVTATRLHRPAGVLAGNRSLIVYLPGAPLTGAPATVTPGSVVVIV